ncbi:MAG: App1 family protein [Gemmataceae bacterium]
MQWLCLMLLLPAADSPVKSDEEVIFFPTAARFEAAGQQWQVDVHGWIFEPERDSTRRRSALAVLGTSLELARDEAQSKRFQERAWLFLADNERGKAVPIRLAGKSFTLPDSDAMGHFKTTLTLSDKDVQAHKRKEGWLPLEAVLRDGDRRLFAGQVFLIPPKGRSVISDIDDTIKISEVRDKQKLLANTFLLPHRAVPGLAELYQKWHEQGAVFHYVSASPWQLFPMLGKFRDDEKFPAGTWHMKDVRFKDSRVANLFASPIEYKLGRIEPLLKAYPERTFLLVGDSGEQDPEVYAELARKYPQQIERIFIRDVTGEKADAPRYKKVFAGLDAARWQIFAAPADIKID